MMCVEGLECMNDDPTSVDVLFAKVFLPDHSDRLHESLIMLFQVACKYS